MSAEFLQSEPQAPAPRDSALGLKGLFEVFVNPSGFFTRLKNDPKILVPYLVGLVLVVAFVAMTWRVMDVVQMDIGRLLHEKNEQIPLPTPGTFTKSLLGGSIAWALVGPFAALRVLFWGNFVMAGKARFGQILSVMLYAEIIAIVGKLLLAPLMISTGSPYVSYSLAALFPQDPFSPLRVVLGEFDLFQIWEVIVIGIGLSILYGFSRNKGLLLSVLSMGFLIALKIGLQLLALSFVG